MQRALAPKVYTENETRNFALWSCLNKLERIKDMRAHIRSIKEKIFAARNGQSFSEFLQELENESYSELTSTTKNFSGENNCRRRFYEKIEALTPEVVVKRKILGALAGFKDVKISTVIKMMSQSYYQKCKQNFMNQANQIDAVNAIALYNSATAIAYEQKYIKLQRQGKIYLTEELPTKTQEDISYITPQGLFQWYKKEGKFVCLLEAEVLKTFEFFVSKNSVPQFLNLSDENFIKLNTLIVEAGGYSHIDTVITADDRTAIFLKLFHPIIQSYLDKQQGSVLLKKVSEWNPTQDIQDNFPFHWQDEQDFTCYEKDIRYQQVAEIQNFLLNVLQEDYGIKPDVTSSDSEWVMIDNHPNSPPPNKPSGSRNSFPFWGQNVASTTEVSPGPVRNPVLFKKNGTC